MAGVEQVAALLDELQVLRSHVSAVVSSQEALKHLAPEHGEATRRGGECMSARMPLNGCCWLPRGRQRTRFRRLGFERLWVTGSGNTLGVNRLKACQISLWSLWLIAGG